MGDPRNALNSGAAEKIFDLLTVLIVNHELLLGGAYGPVSDEQKKILTDLIARSKDIAALLREFLPS